MFVWKDVIVWEDGLLEDRFVVWIVVVAVIAGICFRAMCMCAVNEFVLNF